ncbi:uncharacterized protein ARMOST_15082 [Armillaria ostoyae]|uniref:Uncharacterized protein n=1 Tax=Armillaria ostoyae TaxID=47428 RepID=A0A284RSD9_ARMOS|nr:uncharacterized protein ARMOST_15082 [Armillaria ostoyae]
MTVDILKATASAAASVPVLGVAVGIVSRILDQISQAQQNTELALRIATRCARALTTISEHLDTLENISAISNSIDRFVENLREVQDFIDKEINKNIFYLFIFAKQRAEQFQDLQLKVQDSMQYLQARVALLISLFYLTGMQIKTLLTLYDIVQRYSSDDSKHRTDKELNIVTEKELFVGNGFRLHLGQVNRENAVIKVFEGDDAQKNCEETVEFERDMMFVFIAFGTMTLQFICTPQTSKLSASEIFLRQRSFTLHNVQTTAEQFIAAAIPSGIIPAFIAGARLISGVSSALSRLRTYHRDFNSVRIENFSIFMNSANRAVLSFDGFCKLTSATSGRERTGLDILNDLCHQTFNNANEILYRDTLARTSDTSELFELPFADAEDEGDSEGEGESNAAPGKPSAAVTIDANLSQSRREIIWQRLGGNSVTLDDISHQFETGVESLSFTLFSLEYVARTARNRRTVHRCPGYRREEVTLRPVLSDCKVITHATPSLHEKCVICGQHVEEGPFSCRCRRPDDGISPTVKCTKCSLWGHKHCNDQNDPACWRCGAFADGNGSNTHSATPNGPPGPPSQRSGPPQWLATCMQGIQYRFPSDKIEVVIRKITANSDPEWRIKCLDCPGKLFKPGPGETLSNFEIHLRNKGHVRAVEKRVAATSSGS